MERLHPKSGEVIAQCLDSRLVTDRRKRILAARCGLCRILAALAVDFVEPLRLRVVRLEILDT